MSKPDIKVISSKDIQACPLMRLDPAHYSPTGNCYCGVAEGKTEAQVRNEQAQENDA